MTAESTVETTPTIKEFSNDFRISPSRKIAWKLDRVGGKNRPTLGSVTWMLVLKEAANSQTIGKEKKRETRAMAVARRSFTRWSSCRRAGSR
ncbi:hypothetical protein [Kibdelosporangium aridum]|uniref:Uncharacterized protein n=1 Tax=Kibdelosporangium aridum TaxID=2030 RepID=A0A1W2B739_KIBAR|nr:hypothetical protein [Kibdelosporangium aridum]SMC68843.1 hypothetical protein SAMN05661093_01443 [Kibdelosporangium aridum]